jgi:hypothetical protein
MKISTVLGIALTIAVFIAGTVIAMGSLGRYFLPGYAAFLVILAGSLIYLNRWDLEGEMLFTIIAAVVFIGILTMLMGDVRDYWEQKTAADQTVMRVTNEIDNMKALNQYYQEYATYLGKTIKQNDNNTKMLQESIDKIDARVDYLKLHPNIVYEEVEVPYEVIVEIPVEVPVQQPRYSEEEDDD